MGSRSKAPTPKQAKRKEKSGENDDLAVGANFDFVQAIVDPEDMHVIKTSRCLLLRNLKVVSHSNLLIKGKMKTRIISFLFQALNSKKLKPIPPCYYMDPRRFSIKRQHLERIIVIIRSKIKNQKDSLVYNSKTYKKFVKREVSAHKKEKGTIMLDYVLDKNTDEHESTKVGIEKIQLRKSEDGYINVKTSKEKDNQTPSQGESKTKRKVRKRRKASSSEEDSDVEYVPPALIQQKRTRISSRSLEVLDLESKPSPKPSVQNSHLTGIGPLSPFHKRSSATPLSSVHKNISSGCAVIPFQNRPTLICTPVQKHLSTGAGSVQKRPYTESLSTAHKRLSTGNGPLSCVKNRPSLERLPLTPSMQKVTPAKPASAVQKRIPTSTPKLSTELSELLASAAQKRQNSSVQKRVSGKSFVQKLKDPTTEPMLLTHKRLPIADSSSKIQKAQYSNNMSLSESANSVPGRLRKPPSSNSSEESLVYISLPPTQPLRKERSVVAERTSKGGGTVLLFDPRDAVPTPCPLLFLEKHFVRTRMCFLTRNFRKVRIYLT